MRGFTIGLQHLLAFPHTHHREYLASLRKVSTASSLGTGKYVTKVFIWDFVENFALEFSDYKLSLICSLMLWNMTQMISKGSLYTPSRMNYQKVDDPERHPPIVFKRYSSSETSCQIKHINLCLLTCAVPPKPDAEKCYQRHGVVGWTFGLVVRHLFCI